MTFINEICGHEDGYGDSCELWFFMMGLFLLVVAVICGGVGLVFLIYRLIYRLMFPSGKEPTDQKDYLALEANV